MQHRHRLGSFNVTLRHLNSLLVNERVADKDMVDGLRTDYFRLLPNSCFYTIQGNISAFILASFGSVTAVAGLADLSTADLQTYFHNIRRI